jgi:hypothetical protein
MRRVIALVVALAFAAASGAPAIAACRMGVAQKKCCCSPASANVLCAPDCCARVKATQRNAAVSTHARNFSPLAIPLAVVTSHAIASLRSSSSPGAVLLVGLHQRAAPRLPLRV